MAKEDILVEEDLEISSLTGTAPVTLHPRLASIFPALTHRNFQLYYVGQVISFIGFWLQQVGLGWLVFSLTHSDFWVGAVMAIGGLPFMIVTPFAGVFIDRTNKQQLLIITQSLELILSAFLGILALTGHINLTIIMVLAFITGIVGSFDIPTRLTFLIEMIGKKDLASATALNNSIFNIARFVGPALAGILISAIGVSWVFIANAISFIPAIIAILMVKVVYKNKVDVETHPVESLKMGFIYSFTHPKILYFIIFAFLTAILIWPYQTLMPVIAGKLFKVGAGGYGSLLSAAGFGSLIGALLVSALSKRENKITLVLLGILISTISLILFAISHSYLLAHLLLAFTGLGIIMLFSTLSTLVQLSTPDELRGRVMAVYLTMFIGMMPIGNIVAGFLSEKTSPQFTLGLGAITLLTITGIFYFKGIFSSLAKN